MTVFVVKGQWTFPDLEATDVRIGGYVSSEEGEEHGQKLLEFFHHLPKALWILLNLMEI